MKNLVTKVLGKFEFNGENSIFARDIREKILRIHAVHSDKTEMFIQKLIVNSRKLSKALNSRNRVNLFLTNLLESFEKEHELMVRIIETNQVKENEMMYLACKHKLSVIIRAKRRFGKIKTDKEEMKSFLGKYINNKRFEQKYRLQYN